MNVSCNVLYIGANAENNGFKGIGCSPLRWWVPGSCSCRCPGSQESIPWYRVVADVQPCKGKVEAVALVHIFFQDGLVTVTQNKGVWVSQDTRAVSPLGFVLPVAVCLRSLWPMCPNVCFLHRSLQFVSLGLYLCQYFKLSPFLLAEFLRSKSTVK